MLVGIGDGVREPAVPESDPGPRIPIGIQTTAAIGCTLLLT